MPAGKRPRVAGEEANVADSYVVDSVAELNYELALAKLERNNVDLEASMVALGRREGTLPNYAVLDGGATALMAGELTVRRYLAELDKRHFPVKDILAYASSRPFRFGDSRVEVASWCIYIPTFFAGEAGVLLLYVVPGSAPVLFPRPLMERFRVQVDFGKQTVKWGNRPEKEALTTTTGHYVVDLLEDYQKL